MKIALCARVSSDNQDVDFSISARLRPLRNYAAKYGYRRITALLKGGIPESESQENRTNLEKGVV